MDFVLRSTNVVMNYTVVETKVREATNDEPWGPTGAAMQELAHYTYNYEHYSEVMTTVWKRMLFDNKNQWRRVSKATKHHPSVYQHLLWLMIIILYLLLLILLLCFVLLWYGICGRIDLAPTALYAIVWLLFSLFSQE